MTRSEDTSFYSLSDTELLAMLCYGEARGEEPRGQVSVMQVVKNRVEHGGWFLDSGILKAGYSKYHAVCLKNAFVSKLGKYIYQFSCFQDGDPNRDILLALCSDIDMHSVLSRFPSSKVIDGTLEDISKGATHYYSPSICGTPSWAKKMKVTAIIGHHIFCREE